MAIFSNLYDKVLRWSAHRLAPVYLMGLSFMEASFFPIPPDVMLMPMSLAKPEKAWRYAFFTTAASIVGGMFGYLIGNLFWVMIQPWFLKLGYLNHYDTVQLWFKNWGFWAVILAGFTPIPYKIFTITAGAVSMPFFPFFVAACIGRAARFYLVAGLMMWGGQGLRDTLKRTIDWLGWLMVGMLIVALMVYKLY